MRKSLLNSTRVPVEVDVPDAETLRAWRKLAMALVRMFREAWAFIFGGTVDELASDARAAKQVAGKAAGVGGQAIVGVSHGLDAGLRATHGVASAVGTILGALVPRAAPGPIDVAAAASAQDSAEAQASADLRVGVRSQLAGTTVATPSALPEPAPRPALSPVEIVAAVRETVARMQAGDLTAQAIIETLPRQVEKWLVMLDNASAERLVALTNRQLYRHVAGVENAPGLTPVASVSSGSRFSTAEIDRMVQRSLRTMKEDEAHISAMKGRPGSAPRPRLEGEPLYGDEAERSLAATSRMGRAY